MPLEFGLQLRSFPPNGSNDLLAFYDQQIAVLPPEFTSLWVSDHFQFGTSPVLEGWTWDAPLISYGPPHAELLTASKPAPRSAATPPPPSLNSNPSSTSASATSSSPPPPTAPSNASPPRPSPS